MVKWNLYFQRQCTWRQQPENFYLLYRLLLFWYHSVGLCGKQDIAAFLKKVLSSWPLFRIVRAMLGNTWDFGWWTCVGQGLVRGGTSIGYNAINSTFCSSWRAIVLADLKSALGDWHPTSSDDIIVKAHIYMTRVMILRKPLWKHYRGLADLMNLVLVNCSMRRVLKGLKKLKRFPLGPLSYQIQSRHHRKTNHMTWIQRDPQTTGVPNNCQPAVEGGGFFSMESLLSDSRLSETGGNYWPPTGKRSKANALCLCHPKVA